jgi:hypothetical protein
MYVAPAVQGSPPIQPIQPCPGGPHLHFGGPRPPTHSRCVCDTCGGLCMSRKPSCRLLQPPLPLSWKWHEEAFLYPRLSKTLFMSLLHGLWGQRCPPTFKSNPFYKAGGRQVAPSQAQAMYGVPSSCPLVGTSCNAPSHQPAAPPRWPRALLWLTLFTWPISTALTYVHSCCIPVHFKPWAPPGFMGSFNVPNTGLRGQAPATLVHSSIPLLYAPRKTHLTALRWSALV